MIKIYGSDLSSPSNKVRFTANALKIEYEYIKVSLANGENKTEGFLKLNPAGKIPVIVDEGFVLFESNAIIKYLAAREKSELYPLDIQQRATVDQWMDFIALHVNSALSSVVYNRVFAPWRKMPVDEAAIRSGSGFLDRFLPLLENQLAKKAYIAGERFSLADIALLAVLDPVEVAEIDLKVYPRLTRWREQLMQTEFYVKCHRNYADIFQKVTAAA